jgi:hypothetical protein
MSYPRKIKGVLVVVAAMLSSSHAFAGIYTDDMSRCIVASSSSNDRDLLMRWIFVAMATNPKIKDMSSISEDQSKKLSIAAVGLMQRLMLTDCRKQTIEAHKYEGQSAIRDAFSVLGQAAMTDIMQDDATAAYMGSFGAYLDEGKWEALAAEAGINTTKQKPK